MHRRKWEETWYAKPHHKNMQTLVKITCTSWLHEGHQKADTASMLKINPSMHCV
jgi:hypothetical protein